MSYQDGRRSPLRGDRSPRNQSPGESPDPTVGVGRLRQCDWTGEARGYDSDTTANDAGRYTPSEACDDDDEEIDELADDVEGDERRSGSDGTCRGPEHCSLLTERVA